jgi:tetratricopeptide (TPR) repeat protein
MWLVALAACYGEPKSEQVEVERPALEILLTEIRLGPVLLVEGKLARAAELEGLLTAALELGLSDIPGVVPRIPGDGAPLAFRGERAPAARQVDGRATMRAGLEGAFSLELELCVAGGQCTITTAEGTADHPWPAVAAVLIGAANGLEVAVPPATQAAWAVPGSGDAYSEMITGRSAAAYYGLIPPSLTPGDRKRDPVVRAVFLDPEQPLAQWMRARWEVASTIDGGKAGGALVKAQLIRPTSPLLAADQATLMGLTGHAVEALMAWETLVAELPEDPRWWLPLARARLAAGRPVEAQEALEALPSSYAWDPAVAELRVTVAEAVGGATGLDPLLARWQAVDSRNPEPVRRRIDARVRAGAYDDAQALVSILRDRAPSPATEALDVALLVATGRYEQAAERAPSDLAVRIRARAHLEATPSEVPPELPPTDPLFSIVEATAALAGNQPSIALAAAERAVRAAPSYALAGVLQARALEANGRATEAAAAWTRTWELDPAAPGGPVEPRRVASTFRYVEAGLHPVDAAALAPIGPAGPQL